MRLPLVIRAIAATVIASLVASLPPAPLAAQRLVTRADAERAALAAGPRVALARADTALARAAVLTARARPNPSLAATHSGAPPQKHLIVDVPFDAPWARGPRLGSAQAASRSARFRFLSEQAAALLDVDTTYTRALGAQARFRLSRQTARDADSLRGMSVQRRNAGDASDLDVDLATVVAGQQANVASRDSLAYAVSVLTIQTLMGMPADSTTIVLADSLRLGPADARLLLRDTDSASFMAALVAPARIRRDAAAFAMTPGIAAAEASLDAAEQGIVRDRRSRFGTTSFQAGVEWGDPTVMPPDNERLFLLGVSIPLPLFSQNQGAIAQSVAERDRARAELSRVRLETRQRIAEGFRELASLRSRVARDEDLVVRADRVAGKSLTAYREGASALPAVLEARRAAREVLAQYIDDLTALLTVQAELRVLGQGVPPQP